MKKLIATLLALCLTTPLLADVKRTLSKDGKRAVEVITGESALARLQKIDKLEKAAALLEKRGYAPTQEVTVVRTIDLQAEARRSAEISPASDYFSSEEGEVIFYPWDDGDDATWEGTIYFLNYATGESAMYDAQLDISSETEVSTVWEVTVYTDATPKGSTASVERESAVQLVRNIQLVQLDGPVDRWVRCFQYWCGMAIRACRLAGKYWARCAVGGCAAAAIGCYAND